MEPEFPDYRITYRDGQLLTARDLTDNKKRDDRLRWLHARYLHHTWGIAQGFDVQLNSSTDAVIIGPGYAVDTIGRDIVLSENLLIPAPNVTAFEMMVLVISYQADSTFRSYQATGCVGGGLDPRVDRPVVSWIPVTTARFGIHIPLASATIAMSVNGPLISAFDLRVRRCARRMVRPNIVLGETESGNTGWTVKDSQIIATVDTSPAGFILTPQYFAVLSGNFWSVRVPAAGGPIKPWSKDTNDTSVAYLGPHCYVSQPTATGFTLQTIGLKANFLGVSHKNMEQKGWTVRWVGIEISDGCRPLWSLQETFFLSGLLAFHQ